MERNEDLWRLIVHGIVGPATRKTGAEKVRFDVDIEIDVRALATLLGRRAIKNKSRKAKLAEGLIKVEVRGKPAPALIKL
jgi:hypothetical protein